MQSGIFGIADTWFVCTDGHITHEELPVFHRAPPLVADGGMVTRYGGYWGNKIPGADQDEHCCLAV